MSSEYDWLLSAHGFSGDAQSLFELGQKLEAEGKLHLAATAYDRAFAFRPDSEKIANYRRMLLESLTVVEHSITFRYIPAGSFLMGSDVGEPDEAPAHPVRVNAYWLSETLVSWATYCDLMDWKPPPHGFPKQREVVNNSGPGFFLHEENMIRLQYCEDATTRARDWHAHVIPPYEELPIFELDPRFRECLENGTITAELRAVLESEGGLSLPLNLVILEYPDRASGWEIRTDDQTSSHFFVAPERGKLSVYRGQIPNKYHVGNPSRAEPRQPWGYNRKPMVSVSWSEANELCTKLSRDDIQYRLPTEAEWEKAARGGLIGCSYPWGNERPTKDQCDFDRFDQFSILPMRRFAPNNYGLYAMSGCVWEWTADWYDAGYYADSNEVNPTGPPEGVQKVLRGGSWADCAEVVTVSFRMSRSAGHWRKNNWADHFTPNVGFRLCRVEQSVSD